MFLFRSVSKKEYDLFKSKGELILWHPKKWGVNESVMTEVFGLNKKYKEDYTKKRVRELVEFYMKANGLSESLEPADKTIDNCYDENNIYYNLYTDILNMFTVSLYNYCQCWSEDKGIENFVNISGSDDHYATFKTTNQINEKIDITFKDGRKSSGRLRLLKVDYKDYTHKKLIEELIKSFNSSERIFTSLICTLQEKHSKQMEHRLIITLDDIKFVSTGSFANYTKKKYGVATVGCIDDLVKALIIQANIIYESINKQFYDDDNFYITINANDTFLDEIKII